MKKIICALLIALSLVTLCACGTSPADNNGGTSQPNIKEVNVGDEFLAYPDVSFTYTYVKRTYPNPNDPTEVEETRYVIQITEAKLVLTKKNTIAKDESIAGKFYPYVAKLTVKGKTDAALSGKAIQITYSNQYNGIPADGDIEFNGSFTCEKEVNLYALDTYYFKAIELDV